MQKKTNKPRQSWNEYFMGIAQQVATRSTCPRKNVGCVIVKNKTIIATGYNGSLPGDPHCDTHDCFLKDNHCIRTIHAETNAINQAARNGVSLDGATIYCNVEPCWNCYKNIIASGIKTIFYAQGYGNKPRLHQEAINQNTVEYHLLKT